MVENDGTELEALPAYDANGNPTTWIHEGVSRTLAWDALGRLISISGGFSGTSYDPFGRRIAKMEQGVSVQYQYDGLDVVAEYNATSTLLATYVFGPGIDEPLKVERGGTIGAFHSDGLGSVVLVSNLSTGADLVSHHYDAFGEETGGSGSFENAYTFTGRERDGSGLYYYRARYYLASTGRFLTPDPIGLKGGTNPYVYVGSNPVNYRDPFGLLRNATFTTQVNPVRFSFGGAQPRTNGSANWLGAPGQGHLGVGSATSLSSTSSISSQSQGAQSRDYDLSFNGTTLELYGEEGGIAGKWEGVSGRPGFQDPAYQWLPDKGPLPEGYYLARQSRLEQFPTGVRGAVQEALGLVGRGQWPGGRIAWGDYRVWLEPIRGTDPLGRSGFSIHGGLFPGTRGCIDLCGAMPSFVDSFRATGRDLVLRVQYPGGP